MKTQILLLAVWMTLISCATASYVQAEQTVTVTSKSDDISQDLDLKAVANLFGEVKDLEAFETELNSAERHLSNLDLNGDGKVDYLRVIEVTEDGKHLVIIQAVLAEDIYQDVATIYVEKNDDKVAVQIIGDEYLYGKNYVIEPVYIYRPVIYDWFWGPYWTCWHSPYYWGYYPYGWGYYDIWMRPVYVEHIYVYHHDHCCCSYHYATAANQRVERMRQSEAGRAASQRDYATRYADNSFAARNANMTNVRDLQRQSSQQVQGQSSTRNVQRSSASSQRAQSVSQERQHQTVERQNQNAAQKQQATTARSTNRGFSVAGTKSSSTSSNASSGTVSATSNRTSASQMTSSNRTASTHSSQNNTSSSSMRSYSSGDYNSNMRSMGSSSSSMYSGGGTSGGGMRSGVSGSAGGGSSRGR